VERYRSNSIGKGEEFLVIIRTWELPVHSQVGIAAISYTESDCRLPALGVHRKIVSLALILKIFLNRR
jgi:hypothetical protein